MSFEIILQEWIGWAVAGGHLAFVGDERMSETDATILFGISAISEITIAIDNMVKERTDALADVVKVTKCAGMVGVKPRNSGSELASTVADAKGVRNPTIVMAILGTAATESFD